MESDFCNSNFQSVDDAISKYKILSEKVFTSKSNDHKATFDHHILELEIKNVVATAVPSGQSPFMQLKDIQTDLCRTFVVATSLHAGGAVRMRSYGTRFADAFSACIWQVARATSAAPTFFAPVEINDVLYGDGGTGWNNPTREAITEARNIWPNRPIGIVISIGTGLEEALQLNENSTLLSELTQVLLSNTSPKSLFQLAVAEYAVRCLTSCEMVQYGKPNRTKALDDEGVTLCYEGITLVDEGVTLCHEGVTIGDEGCMLADEGMSWNSR